MCIFCIFCDLFAMTTRKYTQIHVPIVNVNIEPPPVPSEVFVQPMQYANNLNSNNNVGYNTNFYNRQLKINQINTNIDLSKLIDKSEPTSDNDNDNTMGSRSPTLRRPHTSPLPKKRDVDWV